MKKLNYIILTFLIISIIFNFIQYKKENIEREVIVERCDTIIQTKFKTDTIYFTDTQYKYITVNDTVYIESKNKEYKDSTDDYDITINAVKLNSYQLNIHKRDTIQYENKIIKEKRKPLGISVFMGPSYDIINNKFGVSVGIGINFRLN